MTTTMKYPIVALCAFGMSLVHAAPILTYNFTTDLNPSSVDANASGTGITGTYATEHPDLIIAPWGHSSAGNMFLRGTVTEQSFNAGLYFQFVLTPDAGYQLDLNAITLDFGASRGGGAPNSFTSNLLLRSSVDGYANDIASTPTPVTITNTTSTLTWLTGVSFDLSGPAYDNVSAPLTFRMYIFDNSQKLEEADKTANGMITRLDNITVDGAVSVIPEPGTLALLLIGLGSAVLLRRKRI